MGNAENQEPREQIDQQIKMLDEQRKSYGPILGDYANGLAVDEDEFRNAISELDRLDKQIEALEEQINKLD